MPSTVTELFDAAGLTPTGVTQWGKTPSETSQGVYLVALTDKVDAVVGCIQRPKLSMNQILEWMRLREKEFSLDGIRNPSPESVAARLTAFWLPDEVVLYIGQTGAASGLRRRIGDYYSTLLGARKPHAGGHWIQTLADKPSLFVHYCPTSNAKAAEVAMMERFCAGISDESGHSLFDSAHPFPFANLEWPKGHVWPTGNVKAHGMAGQREPRSRRRR